jgi:hypothetical protein
MTSNVINPNLPEFVQQIQALVDKQKKEGHSVSFVRIADVTRDWIWNEGYNTATLDIQEAMQNSSQSIQQIIGLKIQIDNSLPQFQFVLTNS